MMCFQAIMAVKYAYSDALYYSSIVNDHDCFITRDPGLVVSEANSFPFVGHHASYYQCRH